MAQGKLKVKTKLPKNVQAKKKVNKGGASFTKRANRPIQPKKKSFEEGKKLKQIITKTVNKAVEEEIRMRASDQPKNLSKAQQAVAEYHLKSTSGPS